MKQYTYKPPREALRQAREEAGLTVEQAAKLAGYRHKSSWAMVELGYNTPPLKRMLRIAQVVGRSPSELFEELKEVERLDSADMGRVAGGTDA